MSVKLAFLTFIVTKLCVAENDEVHVNSDSDLEPTREIYLPINSISNYTLSPNEIGSSNKMEGFIVGGSQASIKRFPHAAYLSIQCKLLKPRKVKSVESIGCGSSILNQAILVTAAHCVDGCDSSSHITIKTGTENLLKGFVYHSAFFVKHPKYDKKKMENDIALIRIKGKIKLGNNVKRVVLLRSNPTVMTAYVSGWGLIEEEQRITTKFLKLAAQTILARDECRRILPSVPTGTFCARGSRQVGFAAQGDSGSGLIADNYILIGLVSFKYPDYDNELAVYTDVSYFYDWIKETSQMMFCALKEEKKNLKFLVK